ncbi:MAG: TIGR04066 family peptide maturation system protein [bacterium]|nr:TIGR04066 family peptide maturation system protein [bacterium]
MKKRALLYPYSKENYQILKHRDLLQNFEIVGIKSDRHEFLQQLQTSYIYWNDYLDVNFNHIEFDQYEAIIIGEDAILEQKSEDKVFKIIKENAENNKDIIILYHLNDKQYLHIYNLCNEKHVRLEIYSGLDISVDKISLNSDSLNSIDTPIILVSGMTERVSKFDVQLSLRKHFVDKGYKVCQIGSKSFSELFGFYSFPQFMFKDLSSSKKILYFNAFCKSIECGEKPDLIIIGVPGSLIPYNKTFTNMFGTTAFEIGNAINADAVIMNLSYEEYGKEYFDRIEGLVENRLGDEILCYVLSNSHIDSYRSHEEKKMTYITVDKERNSTMVERYNELQEKPVYNILNEKDMQQLGKFVEQSLLSEEAILL